MLSSVISFPNKLIKSAFISVIIMSFANISVAQEITIIHPGAPGEASQELSPENAIEISDTSHSQDDVRFMQNMIPHHNQAVEMAALVGERTNLQDILDVAGRIDASQLDEIEFMEQWLQQRGQAISNQDEHRDMHAEHAMMGMATAEQMAELAQAKGTEFDQLFLTLMMRHHDGAVKMVRKLHRQPGAAYDPILFEFTNDVINDQESEIKRMEGVLVGLSSDPRANLSAGFDDAGEAILNMQLVTSLPKPPGFFDPLNPAGLPREIPKEADDTPTSLEEEISSTIYGDPQKTNMSRRSPLLSFSNTDMAFSGNKLVVGNYHGFNAYQLQENGTPELFSSIVCPGGQGDVSIVGDLLIMSVEQTRGRVDCGLGGIGEDVSDERFRGIRIFNISDITRPVQVGQVQTCRGSHTHSIVSAPDADKIVVYNSGTSSVRDEEEMDGCIGDIAGDDRTAMFRIDVIEIPVSDPSKARIVGSPAVFADEETGRMAGLWQGGDHGNDTQRTSQTNQCHDITVFPERNIAAGACSGNGIIFDISDPLNPKRMDEVTDKGFAYWHSATFNNDGTKVIFTDEWGGGGRPRCRAHDPKTWGADAIYDIIDGELVFRGNFKLPAPQVKEENCVAHNGSSVPVPGRDIFVQAWYQGGISVIDFTDSSNPVEIAFFDRGPISDEHLVTGGFWSSYWYKGKIYGTEIVRGLDVLALLPSEYLSENEIAAATIAIHGEVFNPQQQLRVTWPDTPVVARAYIDQLARDNAVSEQLLTSLNAALNSSQELIENSAKDGAVAEQLNAAASNLTVDSADFTNTNRLNALKDILKGIAVKIS